MHKVNCAVCGGPLMKRVCRRDPEVSDHGWTSRRELSAIDSLHPADQYEWVSDVWCPQCGLKYMAE